MNLAFLCASLLWFIRKGQYVCNGDVCLYTLESGCGIFSENAHQHYALSKRKNYATQELRFNIVECIELKTAFDLHRKMQLESDRAMVN